MRITALTIQTCTSEKYIYPKSRRASSHPELISVQACPESVSCDTESYYPDSGVNPVTTPISQAKVEKKALF